MSNQIDCDGKTVADAWPKSFSHTTVGEIRAFLKRGIPMDLRDAEENTTLMRAVLDDANYSVVKALLDQKIPLNISNKSG